MLIINNTNAFWLVHFFNCQNESNSNLALSPYIFSFMLCNWNNRKKKKKKLELIKFKTKAAAQDSNFFKINFFDWESREKNITKYDTIYDLIL